MGDGECNLGSELRCNGYDQLCSIITTKGAEAFIEPQMSCASKGVLECESGRTKLESKRWMVAKTKADAKRKKQANEFAMKAAKRQAIIRKETEDMSAKKAKES